MSDTLPALRATLSELVAMDTTSSRPNAPLIDYAQARLEAAGFSAERQRYTDDAGVEKFNLVAVKGGSGRAALALVGHSDCVPYDAAWTDALRLTEKDGRLYARGACDTKGFIACALHAAEHAEQVKTPLMVVLTADEEVGLTGAKKLVEAGLGRARHAIVASPRASFRCAPTKATAWPRWMCWGRRGTAPIRTRARPPSSARAGSSSAWSTWR